MQLKKLPHRLRRVQHRALLQALRHGPARQFQHRQYFGAFGRAQAFDLRQRFGVGVQQAGYAAKALGLRATFRHLAGGAQQFVRQLQHVFAGDAGAQQDG